MDQRTAIGRIDRHWIVRRFAAGAARRGGELRGDHVLNPQSRPRHPLTPAAVLIPIVEHADGLTLMFTRRTEDLATHAGQISFPGGHVEPHDGSPEDTAVRECEEEIGLDLGHLEIVGRLDDYRTRTGFLVHPVVALVRPPFTLDPDPKEVAEVFEAPLSFFLDAANHQVCSREFEGVERRFYAMPYGDYYIWGATAGILVNLYEHLVQS